ncbi:family 20 glycosylhydrolase [Alistipes shahii]|jgi:hexosaminidase|uniref:glycoside hydrolase family 20 protein n=1 Tax=Alistipes shahii TaxID=328814 RepID=UPI002431305A|nr:family 20 glycosylhydrolase [Alistipes shahii]MCI7593097.1 glycoside hydrolase family 20 protein [Alistipes shahii]MDY4931110.1 family 20 glycosylhydrolase [Alistipes shahii]
MKKLLLTLAAGIVLCSCGSHDPQIAIVPYPNHLETGRGTYRVTDRPVTCDSRTDERTQRAVVGFAARLATVTGGTNPVTVADEVPASGIRFVTDESLPAEGYELNVDGEGIEVRASQFPGFLYALQSLEQLLPAAVYGTEPAPDAAWEVPCVKIADAPRFAYRGMHLDVARHFFSVDEVKRYIDVMAIHKLNTLHWHLTDDQGWRIEIKRYPELTAVGSIRKATVVRKEWGTYDGTPYGGFYTQDEIRDVVKYAADRGVTVIPEIDLPGHMLAALTAYPELGCTGGPYEVWGRWGVADDVLCPGREKTFEFLEGVLTEVMELFPSEYIHIGGDECPKVRWEKCPRCQAKIRQLGLKDDGEHTAEHYLQSYVTDRIGKFLAQHGRRIIGWDEILEGRAPSDAVVMSWRGSEGGIAAAKLGHDVIMTPNSHFYFDYYQSLDTDAEPFGIGGYIPMEQVYSYDPAFPELTPEQQKHILGVQANLWTEYVLSDEHLEYMLLPRLAALSEVQWCLSETKDWNRFIGSFRMDKIYSQLGYEFAKHIFGVTASYAVDPEKGGVVMTLTTQGGAPIRYTLDGSDPTASSPLYKAPVTIGESCTFKAAALREGMQTPVYTRKFDFNKATGRRIALNAAPTLKYTYGGASLLVDGYRGGPVYSNGAWIGFLNEPLDVTIDMQGAKPYSAVTVESLVEKGEWVFPPSSVGVYLSDDGREFTEAALMSVPQETAGSPDGVKPFKVLFPETSARYLRVVARTVDPIPAWHGAAGQKAHMFVDEIIVE